MDVKRTLANGLNVLGLSSEEMCAIINFSSINLDSFPFQIFGFTTAQIDQEALAGYTSLMQAKAFKIGPQGYPELVEDNSTIVNAITSLRHTDEFLVARMTIERRRLQLVIAKTLSSWSISWKAGKQWYVVAADEISSVTLTVYNLLKSQIRKSFDGGPVMTLDFMWFNMEGAITMKTQVKSKSNGLFRENRPDDEVLAMVNSSWPQDYFYGDLMDRIEQLVSM